ncbi:hypothetical protein JCM10296v2_002127 [Rhodotorula toruloides]
MQNDDLVAPAAAPATPIIPRDPEVAAADAAKAPSPAAQEQPVASPQKDEIIDLTLESDDEVDEKPVFKMDSSAPKSSYRTFVPGQPIRWTATTSIQSMLNIVSEREDIFAKQRKINIAYPSLEAQGYRLANEYMKDLGSATVPNSFKAYLRFCKGCNITPFPMTNAILDLCMFAKCSETDGVYRTFKGENGRVASATEEVFAGAVGYDDMRETEPYALDDFLRETDTMEGLIRKTRPATRARTPPSESEGEDDGDSEDGSSSSSDDDEDGEYSMDAEHEAAPAFDVNGTLDAYALQAKQRLPDSQDSFETLDDLFGQAVSAVVPVYGISVFKSNCSSISGQIRCNRSTSHWDHTLVGKCPFKLYVTIDPDTGRWTLDNSRACYAHLHGPTRGILANPSWRPKMRNPVARRKMGLPTLLPPIVKRKNAVVDEKKRHSSEDASKAEKKRKVKQGSPNQQGKRQYGEQQELLGKPVAEQPPPVGQYFEPFQLPMPPPVPAPASFVQPAAANSFIPVLQSILGIWNGRLVPLAPALVAAGISSLADFGGLFHMPQVALHATLAAVRDHAIPAQGSSADGQHWDGLVSLLADKIKEEVRR